MEDQMKGKILGYDANNKEGAIKGTDGNRYSFQSTEWKGTDNPLPDTAVDFITDDGIATQIYPIRDRDSENNKMILGIVSLLLTFFLGFIGTLISRLAISKIPFSKTVVPTLIHFTITLIAFIPVVGWGLYLIGNIYFMWKNYKLIGHDASKN
jgi:hypothetical protein